MKNIILIVSVIAGIAFPALARADKTEGGIGVGAEFQIDGFGGASMNFDSGAFHAGGFLGFADGGGDDDTDVVLGGRFYYHVHSTPMSDFSVGGSLGLGFIDSDNPPDESETQMYLEPGVQIRAFVSGNVAFSFTAGISLGLIDADGVVLTGGVMGSAGVHYYFW